MGEDVAGLLPKVVALFKVALGKLMACPVPQGFCLVARDFYF